MIQFDFTGKTVLITGGSRGIGKSCAQLFAGANANVVITYKSAKAEAEKIVRELGTPGLHAAFALDVAQPSMIESVWQKILQQYNSIDILVNNAGIFTEHKILETDFRRWQDAWQQTLATNLVGVSNLCFFAARHMKEKGGGKIVNISSRGAFRGEPDHPAYGASKAGLNAMSQSLAIALAPHNISVGVIAPGFVETDMAKEYLEGEEGERIKRQSPLNRVASPEEVARAVAVFASNGTEFMTGGIIDVNGASYLRS
ncbi:SDR family NAD(P)-dependent oxidoreductase [Flavisolibacter nicotianae]|uniref:SDR family NAD(P)-dependent oxidoreductase n=1 Tax=Flavisolibacter nicotianae TaxID=2364882 RepID=UPI000EACD8D1|nr:SDR family oxidoreductase [Flavisolibacter nicotianae]